jgi:hypothetical protein
MVKYIIASIALPGDSILFCMDIQGLYPSVPKKEGLNACTQALENRPNTNDRCPFYDTE